MERRRVLRRLGYGERPPQISALSSQLSPLFIAAPDDAIGAQAHILAAEALAAAVGIHAESVRGSRTMGGCIPWAVACIISNLGECFSQKTCSCCRGDWARCGGRGGAPQSSGLHRLGGRMLVAGRLDSLAVRVRCYTLVQNNAGLNRMQGGGRECQMLLVSCIN